MSVLDYTPPVTTMPDTSAVVVLGAVAFLADRDFWDFHMHGAGEDFAVTVNTTPRVAAKLADRFGAGAPMVRRLDTHETCTRVAHVGPLFVEIKTTQAVTR